MGHDITRRKFLITTATGAAAVVAWNPLFTPVAAAAIVDSQRLSLDGGWQVSEAGKGDWTAAMVPGCVHTDLLAAGRIPDPFYRDNEKAVQWISDSDWLYRRTFDVPAALLKNERVRLRCDGFDTIAVIKINGVETCRADNMFRRWEVEVKSLLHAGENAIEVFFKSPNAYIKEHEGDDPPQKWIRGRAWLRKEQCSYGWDWGPVLASSGIWKSIGLEAFNRARIADVLVRQNHGEGKVTLNVDVTVEAAEETSKPLKANLSVQHNGKFVASGIMILQKGNGRGSVEIHNPSLWWPAGMGEQALYEVRVELQEDKGHPVDSATKRIGLRQLKAVLPRDGAPLHFEVNGVPFFAKGANWIPADSFPTRMTPEILRRFVADAVAVNMNMLRFWGGGYYEEDELFDACDEMGVCVWLDFKFACAAYPAFDDNFMENVRLEAADNLKRLRHHPCIAVWCGNNEISLSWWEGPTWDNNRMSTADYDKLFKDLIGSQVREFAPDADYVSGSPDCGDTHYWEVWHGPKSFEAYRTQGGFMSEFGFQSFPQPKTVRAFTNPEDRASVNTRVMNWHQRSAGLDCNQKIVGMTVNYFRPPRDFEKTLWLSQIMQGFGIKIGAEYWRQTMPQSMGCLFWQYNDTWPGMSWSSIDYFGRWKALHYMARRFYSPVLVSGLGSMENGTVDVFITSDLLQPQFGKFTWRLTDLSGKTLAQESMDAQIAARKSEKIKTLQVQDQMAKNSANGFLTWLKVEIEGKTVSDNLVFMAPPKELNLEDPRITADVKEVPDGFSVAVRSQKPALWSWLDLENTDARYSDNFIHVTPDAPQEIFVHPKREISRSDFLKELRICSLFDTYSHT